MNRQAPPTTSQAQAKPGFRWLRLFALAATVTGLISGLAASSLAQDAPAQPAPAATGTEGARDDKSRPQSASAEALLRKVSNEDMVTAIKEGLEYLAGLQDEKGHFGLESTRIATSALSGLALLASGSLPDSGPYSTHLAKLVDYLLSTQDPNSGYFNGEADGSRIHGHGFTLSFLSQAYGHTRRDRDVRRALERGVQCLEEGQTKEGGWGYVPSDLTWDENSTTVCCLQGLRDSQNAGIAVKKTVMQAAMGYLEKMSERKTFRDSEGKVRNAYTFKYSLDTPASDHSYALTAACCSCLNHLGVYSAAASWDSRKLGEILDGGMVWLRYRIEDFIQRYRTGGGGLDSYHFYYANFYAAQACWQYADVTYFETYFPLLRDVVLADRRTSGTRGWRHNSYGPAYGTAFALLILQVPYQYLPAFQR